MISADYYEEMYLKNKDVSAVEREVRHLRAEIARRKDKMESPATAFEERKFPSSGVNVAICREYLTLALKYLCELKDGEDARTEEEKASCLIESLNDKITEITLSVGEDKEKLYSVSLGVDTATLTVTENGSDTSVTELAKYGVTEVIDGLFMSEWKAEYTPEQYGCMLNEPECWTLTIGYSDGIAPRTYRGVGVTPYNFDILTRLLGAEI